MTATKDWYASTTVWGGLIAAFSPFFAPLLTHAGITMTPELQASIAAALAAIGGVVAIIGRMRATTQIAAPTKGT